jgi:ArsR family transcriptional regulator, arsenate/arsenite/antimonite-responsive transcriptional repressor
MSKLVLEEDKLRIAMRKFRAVSHPMRMAIIGMLTDLPKMNVTQIYTQLKLDQPAVSFHLKLLKMSGILIGKREGKEIYYSLNRENLTKLIDCIDRINK